MNRKLTMVALASLLAVFSYAAPQKGTMTDSRDGKKYKTVNIGKKVWMVENLNFKTGDSWCYDNSEQNCKEYGRLYSWNAAQKACPDGWRMATDYEWGNVASNSASLDIKTAGFRNAKGKFELLGKRADEGTLEAGSGRRKERKKKPPRGGSPFEGKVVNVEKCRYFYFRRL